MPFLSYCRPRNQNHRYFERSGEIYHSGKHQEGPSRFVAPVREGDQLSITIELGGMYTHWDHIQGR
jgi:hypothetical protein